VAKVSQLRGSSPANPPELPPGQDPFEERSIRHLVARYGSPLFILDAERVRAQYRKLAAALPGVDLYYAVKSLPHPAIIRTLRDAGACFDLATNGEVELVRRLSVDSRRCIHTHPIKRDGDIRTALSFGVTRFVVDNPDEIRKFVAFKGSASLLIRIAFHSTDAVCNLSRKFGCEPDEVRSLLALARKSGIKVDGLSFHAGSQARGPGMHVEAIEVCRRLIAAAAADGHELRLLDIGGGFPVDYLDPAMDIEEFCAPIRRALEPLQGAGFEVIAEPGRYLSAPSAIVVSSVMGRALRAGRWWYYLDDGLYGSYSGRMFDHAAYPLKALVPPGPLRPSVLAGPTCDSIDVIDDTLELPELEVNDLIVGREMGAYTWATSSEFNFFPRATVLALDGGRLLREESLR
jgi:ornithine decarboxylase